MVDIHQPGERVSTGGGGSSEQICLPECVDVERFHGRGQEGAGEVIMPWRSELIIIDAWGEIMTEVIIHLCQWVGVYKDHGPNDRTRGQAAVERMGRWLHDYL